MDTELTSVPAASGDAGDPLVVRKHTIRVIEILKDDGIIKKRSYIKVAQVGGTLEIGGREISTPYEQPIRLLEKGDEVIVALREWPRADGFTLRWGAASIFTVERGNVTALGAAKQLPHFAGGASPSLAEFKAAIRR